jgi:predicted Zn-dependent protease
MEPNIMENNGTEINAESLEKLTRLRKFLGYDPENETLWIDSVRLALELKEWQVAREIVDVIPDALLKNAEVNALAGQVLLVHQAYEQAIVFLKQAIDLQVNQTAVWINLAYCYFYLDQFSEAATLLDTNPHLKEAFPQDYLMLSARLANHLDDPEKSIQLLQEMHDAYGITAESAGLLSLLLFEADRDYDAAMQMANWALARNPHVIEALLARASLQLELRAYDSAQADIQIAVTHHPQIGRAWATLAQIEFNNFNFELARNAAETAVKTMPDHIGTWHLLGWAYLMLADYEKALWAFQESYELDRRFAETHGGLASAYAHLGETKLANNHIKLAERLDAETLSANYAKMVLMQQNNENDKAQELFNNWATGSNSKLSKTPQELINIRMQELMQQHSINKSTKNTLH